MQRKSSLDLLPPPLPVITKIDGSLPPLGAGSGHSVGHVAVGKGVDGGYRGGGGHQEHFAQPRAEDYTYIFRFIKLQSKNGLY